VSITIELAHNPMKACEQALLSAAESGARTAWLLPDYARALERRKFLATTKSALRLGCTVSSLSCWVEDLWALYGDGRSLVSPIQRKILMKEALLACAKIHAVKDGEGGGLAFPASPGTVDLFARMVEQGAGLGSFVEALAHLEAGGCPHAKADLSPTEQHMLKVAGAYQNLLTQHGLCETAEAMRLLSQRTDIAWPNIVCEDFDKLRPHEAAFFARLPHHTELRFVAEAAPGSRFDSGQAVAQALEQSLENERVTWQDQAKALAETSCGREPSAEQREGVITRIAPMPCEASGAALDTAHDATPAEHELAKLRKTLYYPTPESPVSASGAVATLLPAGRYAQASLIVGEIEGCESAVLIVCNKPYDMFSDLAPRLYERGIALEAQFARRFADTDFGGAFLNALALAENRQDGSSQASDFALSLFAGIGLQRAYEADASWRGNRLTGYEQIMQSLRECNPDAMKFVELLGAKRYTEALDVAETRFGELASEGEAFRAEQFAAAKCVHALIAEAESLGRDARELLELLENTQLLSSAKLPAEHGHPASVSIVSYGDAARIPAQSYDYVFACNLNATEQSLRQNKNSNDALFESLGYEAGNDALFTARLRMAKLLNCARKRLYLVRSLHNEKTEPTYPAVVFEDIVDCYRGIVSDEDGRPRIEGVSKTSALTAALDEFALTRGEEELGINLHPSIPDTKSCVSGDPSAISEHALPLLCEPLAPEPDQPLRMSPSAIENYLDCPHKWFASNRMRLGEVDAGFSLRESGTFIHEVLCDYYRRLQDEIGTTKPDASQLAQAQIILGETFDATLATQPHKKLRDNPYIPITQAEHKQAQAIKTALMGFAERDSHLAPRFKPTDFEKSFGLEQPFEYAGVLLRGTIDRIDVDEKGRAIIVDYKSSLSSSYNLLASSKEGCFALPPKVQTLIYAQVARKLFGLQVVGAIYLHTQRAASGKPLACGAYDDRLLSKDELLGISVSGNALSKSPFASFEELLDGVEDMIAERLDQLKAGMIEACPQSENACTFCPVISCEGRK